MNILVAYASKRGSTQEVAEAVAATLGGALDPAKLRFPFNRMPASDARWHAIASWATEFAGVAERV